MTIVCGTDFTTPSRRAANLAALLASKLREPLLVAHVLDQFGDLDPGAEARPIFDGDRAQLDAAVAEVRASCADAHAVLTSGEAAPALARIADERDASLLVVGYLGQRFPARWLIGNTAEQLARNADVPCLVVREAPRLEAWLQGRKRLRAIAGVDLATSSEPLARFLAHLRRAGPCDVSAVHVAWPPASRKLGTGDAMDLERLDPKIESALGEAVRRALPAIEGDGTLEWIVRQGFGRVDQHIVTIAEEAGADLIVVGAHRRAGFERLWHGSVARGVVHLATCAVACIPQ